MLDNACPRMAMEGRVRSADTQKSADRRVSPTGRTAPQLFRVQKQRDLYYTALHVYFITADPLSTSRRRVLLVDLFAFAGAEEAPSINVKTVSFERRSRAERPAADATQI